MCQSEQTVSTCEKLQSSLRICQLPLNAYGPLFVMQQCCHPGHIDDSLTFLVFSDSSSSVLSTSFLKGGLFKGSWLQQDSIMLYLQRQRRFTGEEWGAKSQPQTISFCIRPNCTTANCDFWKHFCKFLNQFITLNSYCCNFQYCGLSLTRVHLHFSRGKLGPVHPVTLLNHPVKGRAHLHPRVRAVSCNADTQLAPSFSTAAFMS